MKEFTMVPITITTRLKSETLVLPELRSWVGKTVQIRVTEEPESAVDRLQDIDYLADCEADKITRGVARRGSGGPFEYSGRHDCRFRR